MSSSANPANENYSSQWDIDQLLYPNQPNEVPNITLAANVTSPTYITLKTISLNFPPVFDGVWQTITDTVWRQFGDPKSSGGVNVNTWLSITPTTLSLVYLNFNASPIVVNIRFYVWTDKVNN